MSDLEYNKGRSVHKDMIRSTEEYISMFDATRRDAGNAGDAGAVCGRVREEEEERERRFEKIRESIGE